MIENISKRIAGYLVEHEIISPSEYEVQQYGITVLLIYLLNILVMLVLALIFHRLPETIVYTLSFMIIRNFIGGIHASSPLACTITGIIVWGCMIAAAWLIGGNLTIYLFITLVSSLLAFLFAPAFSVEEKELYDFPKYKKLARWTLLGYLAVILTFFFLKGGAAQLIVPYASLGLMFATGAMLVKKVLQIRQK